MTKPDGTPRLADRFLAIATVGDYQFLWNLVEVDDHHLTGVFNIEIPPPATRGRIELAQVWSTVSHDAWNALASWELNLESLSAASGREYVVLDRVIRARPHAVDQPLPIKNGYQIKVRAQSGAVRGQVTIDVFLGSGRSNLVGDDGIFGWPSVALMHMLSKRVPAPRGVSRRRMASTTSAARTLGRWLRRRGPVRTRRTAALRRCRARLRIDRAPRYSLTGIGPSGNSTMTLPSSIVTG
ncbi:MAG: hypothetical protein ABIP53_05215 [Candidatus Limnocylindrales bacterium]